MKKQTIIKIATLLLISLTLISCNPDNEGVFWRMSKSVPKVDVGAITLIKENGGDLYAFTTKKGPLQKYSGGSWSVINSDKARHFTADNTNIYFAKQAEENKPNEIWSYKIDDGTLTEIANGEHILSMVPTFNLVLVKNGNNYDVKEFNILTLDDKESYNGFFNVAISPQLIASSNTDYIISGLASGSNSKYVHYDDSGTILSVASNQDEFKNYPMIAFAENGGKSVLLGSNGRIWFNDGSNTLEHKNTIPSFSAIEPAFMPYPYFIHDGFMYLQNSDFDFYKVDISVGLFEKINSGFAADLNYVQANSFLVDGQDVYVGTVANGIFKIDMTNNSATSL